MPSNDGTVAAFGLRPYVVLWCTGDDGGWHEWHDGRWHDGWHEWHDGWWYDATVDDTNATTRVVLWPSSSDGSHACLGK